MSQSSGKLPARQKYIAYLFLAAMAVLAYGALVSPQYLAQNTALVSVGQVAAQDFLATQNASFPSQVLTEQRRSDAEKALSDIYTLPDTSVARQQMERLRNAQAYITSVRADRFAAQAQKVEDLAALDDIRFSREMAESVLALNDARWLAVEQEAVSVLEQTMRRSIRPDGLEAVLSTVPAMVSLALSPDQGAIVTEMVQAFLAPNSFYSEDLTVAARQEARDAVEPITRSFVEGQTVVRRGELLDAVDVEALERLGLVSQAATWQSRVAVGVLVVLMGAYLVMTMQRMFIFKHSLRVLVATSLLMMVFLFAMRLTSFGHVVIPYAFPITGFGLLIAALFGPRVALVSVLPLAVMSAYGMANSLELTLYYLLGSLLGIQALGRARRIGSFIAGGGAAMLAGWLVIIIYRIASPATDWLGLLTLFAAAALNGLGSAAVALLFQYLLSQALGTTTPMQLMDLTRPDHPLLQTLLHQAPGTYQHSLQVANLAEQAADRIGADTLLTRVGALYHDCGKAANPAFFIENQPPGLINPHDELDPQASAEIIIRHVTDGMKMARTHRLPKRIFDFITEHHGTTLTRYQYNQAVIAAGGEESLVDETKFQYPGPKPRSRETAILMLADVSEARVRADRSQDEDRMRSLIKKAIAQRISEGQLDNTDLTLRDLDVIAESFTATLRGVYHPRIQYPQIKGSEAAPSQLPAPEMILVGEAKEITRQTETIEEAEQDEMTGKRSSEITTPLPRR